MSQPPPFQFTTISPAELGILVRDLATHGAASTLGTAASLCAKFGPSSHVSHIAAFCAVLATALVLVVKYTGKPLTASDRAAVASWKRTVVMITVFLLPPVCLAGIVPLLMQG